MNKIGRALHLLTTLCTSSGTSPVRSRPQGGFAPRLVPNSLERYGAFVFLFFFWLTPSNLFAFEITYFPDTSIGGDVILRPAKVELSADSGASSAKFLDVLNRTGQDQMFKIEVDDVASEQESGGVVLGKTVDGLNSSLKNYLMIPGGEFVLRHGEQARIPVSINLPRGVSPGGLYGVVLVSGAPVKNVNGATNIVTRIGSLFFVKVNGDVKQSGRLNSFLFEDGKFRFSFENSGDIYLNPYGIINVYGYSSWQLVKKIDVPPWFVLPHSSRIKSIPISDLPSGKYSAEIMLNKGYDNLIDSGNVVFEIENSQRIMKQFWGASLLVAFLVIFFYVRKIF